MNYRGIEGMDRKDKPYFEILNTFWVLLKPYADKEDEKAYKKIMSDNFFMLTKDRGKKFTDAWWDSTQDVVNYPDKYKGTKYLEFATDLAIAFLDYWQKESREETTHFDYMTYVGRAFINEWERVRNG